MDDSTEMKLLLPKLEMRGSVPAINLVVINQLELLCV